MYIRDVDAKFKDCPFKMGRDVYTSCTGKECMAWRWKPIPNPEWKPSNPMLYEEEGDYRTKPPPYIDSKTEGYCGMAVRPNLGV